MKWVVFDCEGDSLTPTKFYCLSFTDSEGKRGTLTDYQDIRDFFTRYELYVGHNIRRWDLPELRRIVGIDRLDRVVDTLGVSWYLEPERVKSGIESYGEDFGILKIEIDDWLTKPLDTYIKRCERDVEINLRLWTAQLRQLNHIYGSEDAAYRFLRYLDFKMECAALAEESGWKLDKEFCERRHADLLRERDAKFEELARAIPRVGIVKEYVRPKRYRNADGQLSILGQRWSDRLVERGLHPEYDGVITESIGSEPGNPGSHGQIKEWLYSLGWKPQTFKHVKHKKTGEMKEVPQINKEHGGGICDSIKLLYDKEPSLELLDGLSVLNHRISILSGFLRDVDSSGLLHARIAGLTNTLRFKHSEIVNLPKAEVKYGTDIRGCLVASSPDRELCGSDCSGLEDRLKQHFIFPYDPEYVGELNSLDYDPHLDIAVLAGGMTEREVSWYKKVNTLSDEEQIKFFIVEPESKKKFKALKATRSIFKNGNYACQYGAGPPRLVVTCGIDLHAARNLWVTYWKRNWAIKAVAEAQTVKEGPIHGKDPQGRPLNKWLLNPANGFWYSLRFEKDIFSTLVQGTGAYCFDVYLRHVLSERPQLTGQFHDEFIIEIEKGHREDVIGWLKGLMKEVNEYLGLNRELDCDVHFGDRYSEIH